MALEGIHSEHGRFGKTPSTSRRGRYLGVCAFSSLPREKSALNFFHRGVLLISIYHPGAITRYQYQCAKKKAVFDNGHQCEKCSSLLAHTIGEKQKTKNATYAKPAFLKGNVVIIAGKVGGSRGSLCTYLSTVVWCPSKNRLNWASVGKSDGWSLLHASKLIQAFRTKGRPSNRPVGSLVIRFTTEKNRTRKDHTNSKHFIEKKKNTCSMY